ncbi:MAG TPA: glycosyltransferase family 4 protein [Thermoflexales bacterium]|nr:glycosyltransferase family 4 protein [Thermoflexales bacterium]HQW33928.1 glycosyltransferase family 4 protein [Thermoflexales bacterium]
MAVSQRLVNDKVLPPLDDAAANQIKIWQNRAVVQTNPRLLQIITLASYGGAQTHVNELIDGLRDQYEIHLATSYEGPLTERARRAGAHVHIIPTLKRQLHLVTDVGAIQDFKNLIDEVKPDLIHAHSSKAGMVSRVAGRICGVPVVYTVHGWAFAEGAPATRRAIAWVSEAMMSPLAARIICVTSRDENYARTRGVLRNGNGLTILHGISDHGAPRANPAAQPPRLIMVARFSPQKDFLTLIQALPYLKERNLKFHVDFAGSGAEMHRSQKLAEHLGVSDYISFLGDRDDVPELLSQSQIFVLSTHYEGLPISILEAMRAGLPIVATNVDGVPEAVREGKNGLLVPRSNPLALAEAIGQMVESPEMRAQMGAESRRMYETEFGVERMLTELNEVYRSAISKQKIHH